MTDVNRGMTEEWPSTCTSAERRSLSSASMKMPRLTPAESRVFADTLDCVAGCRREPLPAARFTVTNPLPSCPLP